MELEAKVETEVQEMGLMEAMVQKEVMADVLVDQPPALQELVDLVVMEVQHQVLILFMVKEEMEVEVEMAVMQEKLGELEVLLDLQEELVHREVLLERKVLPAQLQRDQLHVRVILNLEHL